VIGSNDSPCHCEPHNSISGQANPFITGSRDPRFGHVMPERCVWVALFVCSPRIDSGPVFHSDDHEARQSVGEMASNWAWVKVAKWDEPTVYSHLFEQPNRGFDNLSEVPEKRRVLCESSIVLRNCVFIEQFPNGVCTISSKTPHLAPPTLSASLNAHFSSLPLITFHFATSPGTFLISFHLIVLLSFLFQIP
jgi:hypothetical protein